MLSKELGEWFRTRRWLWQLLIWVILVNGFVGFMLFFIPMLQANGAQTVGTGDMSAIPPEASGLYWALPMMVIFGIAGMVIMAQDEVIQEKQTGTAAWILSKPAARQAFILVECNETCRITFDVEKPDPIVEVQKELYDCNFSTVQGVLLYLNDTVGSLAARSLNESGNSTVSLVYDDRNLRDWIKNDADERISRIREIIKTSVEPLTIKAVDNSKDQLANKSIELAKAQSDLDFQKQKVDTVVAENYRLINSSNNMFWITLFSLLIAVVGASSPYAPSIARRLGMNQTFEGLRKR